MDKLGQEWVSAAVDGEIDEHTLAELAADADSHEQWRDYHLIGDAMRGELPKTMSLDLSASIMAAIDDEPAIVAPQPVATQEPKVSSAGKIIPLFKQFGQYAIAASVALVAVVGVQNYNQDTLMENSPLPVLNTRPLIGSASPVSLQTGAVQQSQSYTNDQVADQRRRINAYIQDHMLQQRLNNGVNIDDNSEVDTTPVAQ
ncbi:MULTISPECIES: sigma-E factor negative regulatory protein [unclassified Shewanella]|uniref:sigma-E factor negative regulatory protein n=1 Tax=unclassified Shewanella TaxID=196818 RepID=UPI001BC17B28|nr:MULTISPECIES: RseA family anti-sigma factor [unclassified Shewanella]GIU17841.1 anti-sigma-E factor RseA [Shewanella sp. MBTL60-112-B1]GIU33291.1 anti-sigma-E factor RseA [Shewanella sp. MBTL60-112-B2]